MESGTAAPESTGSRTIADMMSLAAEKHGDRAAVTYKRGDEWAEVSYREVGEIVSEIAAGSSTSGSRRVIARPCCARPAPSGPTPASGSRVRAAWWFDLPHELARGVRVGGRQLGVALRRVRGRGPGRQDRPSAGSPARARGGDRDRPGGRYRRDRSTTCARAPRARRRRGRRAGHRRLARGPVHVHLHLGNRAAQGLRAGARQLPRRGRHVRDGVDPPRATSSTSTRWRTRSRC